MSKREKEALHREVLNALDLYNLGAMGQNEFTELVSEIMCREILEKMESDSFVRFNSLMMTKLEKFTKSSF